MKKLLLIILLSLAALATRAQTRAGAMFGYGSKTGQLAIGGNMEFFVDDKVSLSPSLLIYFPQTHNEIREFWMEVNFNGNYYFYTQDIFKFYGLGGFNYTCRNHKDKIISDNSYSSGKLNLNIGGGINFNVGDSLVPFSEVRYVVGKPSQAVVVAGLRFNLGHKHLTHR